MDSRIEICKKILGPRGKMICASKGEYNHNNPDNVTVFNSNIVVNGEKIWHGDIDLTISEHKIVELAAELNTTVYVLYEMDARFENTENPLLEKAVYSTDGKTSNFKENLTRIDGKLIHKPYPKPSKEEVEERESQIKASYKEEDYSRVNLKIEGIEESDEEYDYYNILTLTDFFKNLDEENSPLHNFWLYIGKEVGKDAISKVYLTKESSDALKKQFKYWYKVFHGKYSSEYRTKSDINWNWFMNGPNHFQITPDWAVEDAIYVKK